MAIGESEAKAAHQVHRPVVLQVGLGDVRQYLVATAVVGRAVLLVGDGQAAVEQVVAAADRLRRAQVVVLMALEAAAGAQLGVEASVAADALLGHDVDDPAGGAAAVYRAGAGHHLDALDVEWVDGVELPADAPRTVQRHPVDHHQHAASAQVLAVVGTTLGADIQARDQLSQRLLQRHAGLGLLVQLLALDHPDRAGQLADAGRRARADHHHLLLHRIGSQRRSGKRSEEGQGKRQGSRARRDGAGHEEMSELLLF